MRPLRLIVLLALAAGAVTAVPAMAQVPIPIQEQVELFRTLSPAQQQALIRELQSQLPPAQRDAIIGLLQQDQLRPESAPAEDFDVSGLANEIVAGLEVTRPPDVLGPRDTLVIEFDIRDPEQASASVIEQAEFLERLQDGNPYQLDDDGRLLLPGVPSIALSGLNVEEATIRLSTERELRPFVLTLTYLPLAPVGTAALAPYGYDIFRNPPTTFASATDIPVPVGYVVGPGDTINIQLFGNQNQQYFLEVGRDGTINFPEIGPLNVSGLTFDAVRNLIDERVGEQMIGVRASTTLGELRSINVFVLGDVVRPGSYTVSALATMTNALIMSGGVSEIGSLRGISLRRAGETVATLDLYDVLLNGDTSGDLRLQPDDVIFVSPVRATVAVDGEVQRPAIYEINGEQTVAELIELAGGLRANANQSAVKLERIVPGRGISVTDLDLVAAAGADTPVRNGDVLRVEPNLDRLEAAVRLVGNVQREGLYQWRPGMTVSDLLPNAELVRPLSDLNYVLIRRERTANVEIEVLSLDLEAVWQGRPGAVDLALQPRDTVYVFHLETGRQQFVAPIIDELESQAEPNEFLPIVRVGGEVRAEGEYPLEPGMRIGDLLRAGGGLSDSAYTTEVELTRYQIIDGARREAELVDINLAAVLAGDLTANLTLRPYDFLSVREISGWRQQETVQLVGEFVFPGTYPIRQGERLTSVLERAGGLTEFAFPEGAIFTRVSARERELAQLEMLAGRLESQLASMALAEQGAASDPLTTGQALLAQLRDSEATGRTVIRLDDIISGRAGTEIELQNGDALFVPERRQEVTLIGEVQNPSTHIFEQGLTREDYILRSGGLTRRADNRRVYVVRANGEVVADEGRRFFRRDVAIEMRPGDTIVAPLELDRMRPLELWSSVTQIIYNLAIGAAAVNSF